MAASHDFYTDRKLLRRLLTEDDDDIQAALTQHVFPRLRGMGVKFDILRASSFFSEPGEREEFIKNARAAYKTGDSGKLNDMLAKTLNPSPPTTFPSGFRLIREFLGKGKYSYVSLLRRDSDGALFAWKRKTNARSDKGDAFRRHVNLFSLWRALDLTDGEMILLIAPDGSESILHSYAPGTTLKQAYQSRNFFTDESSAEFRALIELFAKLIRNHVVLLDMNTKNIVFHKVRWTVIDSQRPELLSSARETFERLQHVITAKWTNPRNNIAPSDVDRFFRALETRLPEISKHSDGPPAELTALATDILAKHDTGALIEGSQVQRCVELLMAR